jgi:hemerythrin
MPELKWGPDLSVGVAEIDAQHQHFVELVNVLYRAIRAGRGRDALGTAFDELAEYTRTHFTTEEQLLLWHDYPEYAEHKAQHDAMIERVATLRRRFQAGDQAITFELMGTMSEWLVTHIQSSDKRYANFLKAKGVS